MKIAAIVQARMGSSRLPGKVLLKLGEQTVLSHVVDQLKKVASINEIIVATTTQTKDDPIVDEAHKLKVSVFRGDEQHVLSRYYEAAVLHKADVIVRVTSDCPFLDPDVTGKVINLFLNLNADYVSNTIERSFPRGLDTEVFSIAALNEAYQKAEHSFQREHVTPYIYQNPHSFRIAHYIETPDFSNHRWTLDTVDDWEFIQQVYNCCVSLSLPVTYANVLRILAENPSLIRINAHVEQKKLME